MNVHTLSVLVLVYATVLLSSCAYVEVKIGAGNFNVKDYGAKGDGKTLDTAAIQKAFDAAGKAGGGTVQFPSGTYYTFPFQFSGSGTKLVLETGAKILASTDKSGWPGGSTKPAALISASKFNNLAITGAGIIDGNGAVWWPNKNDNRPNLVDFEGTSDVVFSGTTFQNSAYHNLELYSDNTELSNIKILAPSTSPNTDGVDVHGTPFYIHDSTISVGDDNVAVHASNLIVENCNFGTGHGASIGSISSGTYKNITFKGIVFDGTTQACRIKTTPGATGSISDVTFENLTLNKVNEAIIIDMYYDKQPAKPTTMKISDITFSAIKGSVTGSAGALNCEPTSPCEKITFTNIAITPSTAKWNCSNISGSQSNVSPSVCIKSFF